MNSKLSDFLNRLSVSKGDKTKTSENEEIGVEIKT